MEKLKVLIAEDDAVSRRLMEASVTNWGHEAVCADAMSLPFRDGAFDCIFIGYGLRNFPRLEKAVREMLLALGENPDREGLLRTPNRVARSMAEHAVLFDCGSRICSQCVRNRCGTRLGPA